MQGLIEIEILKSVLNGQDSQIKKVYLNLISYVICFWKDSHCDGIDGDKDKKDICVIYKECTSCTSFMFYYFI